MEPTYDPETREWTGATKPPLLNPNASVGQVLLSVLNLNPDRVIQIDADTGRTMTNGEMRLRTIRAAQNLTALGIKKGDMAALACANSENVVPMVLAMLTNGIAFNPLAPNYGVDDMVHMMKITQPRLVFCDASNYETVMEAAELAIEDKPLIYVFECDLEGVCKAEDLLRETGREHTFFPPYLGDSYKLVALVICSSGTTGMPKGVCISHAHFLSQYTSFMGLLNIRMLLNFSPLYWASGFYTLMISLLNGATRLITRRTFDAGWCFDLLEKYPVELIFTPPSYANLLLVHPRSDGASFPSIKVWFFGGSHLSDKIRSGITAMIPNAFTLNIMGNSEVGGFANDLLKQKPLSVGTISPNIRIKVVDERGVALPNNERGELAVKYCVEVLGYYNNPKANAESMDADGWFHSGDIGYLDEEGFLFIVDRKKDLLKYRNYQIAPQDLEMIVEQIEGVSQVCIVGLPDEDMASDLAAAVIVKKEGSELCEEDVLSFVNGKVADYKKLRGGVFFVPEFPLTLTGKTLRRQLKEDIVGMIAGVKL